MRTKLAPCCRPSQSMHVTDRRNEAARRCFKVIAAFAPVFERAPVDAVPGREHLAGRQRNARIDQQHRGSRDRSIVDQLEAVPCPGSHRGHAEQAGRDIGSQRRRDRRCMAGIDIPQAGEQAAARPPRPPNRHRYPRRLANSWSRKSQRHAAPWLPRPAARAAFITRLPPSFASPSANGPETVRPSSSAASASSRSPSTQNANSVSSAWRPSGSLPRTWRARLSLAGAGSESRIRARTSRGSARSRSCVRSAPSSCSRR